MQNRGNRDCQIYLVNPYRSQFYSKLSLVCQSLILQRQWQHRLQQHHDHQPIAHASRMIQNVSPYRLCTSLQYGHRSKYRYHPKTQLVCPSPMCQQARKPREKRLPSCNHHLKIHRFGDQLHRGQVY